MYKIALYQEEMLVEANKQLRYKVRIYENEINIIMDHLLVY